MGRSIFFIPPGNVAAGLEAAGVTEKESVNAFFDRHAEKYSRSASHARGKDLEAMITLLNPAKGMRALDVATGTGFTAIELSGAVDDVFAVDRTRGMLEQARRLSAEREAAGIQFVLGDSTALPFGDASFDIATCRRAAHHFREKEPFLREVHRCLVPGGRLALVDMVSPEGFENIFNGLERTRDSSHEEAETVDRWKQLIGSGGFDVTDVEVEEESVSFEKWLYPVGADTEEGGKSRLFLEDAGDEFREAIGYDAERDTFVKRRAVIIASKRMS